jgi:DNA-nicking Smr family endonuclease
VKYDEKHATV